MKEGPYVLVDISTYGGGPELLVLYDDSVPGKAHHVVPDVWACPYCKTVYKGLSECTHCEERVKDDAFWLCACCGCKNNSAVDRCYYCINKRWLPIGAVEYRKGEE